MSETREWIPLGEAFDLIAKTAAVNADAEKRQPNLPDGWDTADAINLVTEEAMSAAGRLGKLRFRGLKTEYAKKPFPVPTTWFEARAGNEVVAPRGVDPDAGQLWVTPLHQVQDEDFIAAAEFEVKDRADVPRWYDVVVQTETLDIFLTTLGATTPESAPPKRRPSVNTIKNAIAELSGHVTERALIEKLRRGHRCAVLTCQPPMKRRHKMASGKTASNHLYGCRRRGRGCRVPPNPHEQAR